MRLVFSLFAFFFAVTATSAQLPVRPQQQAPEGVPILPPKEVLPPAVNGRMPPEQPPVYDESYKLHPPSPGAASLYRHAQAGFPLAISPHAIRSDTGAYVGYYIGGGCVFPFLANPRSPIDGTWGWDYRGWFFPRRIILGWWHGRRYQGGTGQYRSDGPTLNFGEKTLRPQR